MSQNVLRILRILFYISVIFAIVMVATWLFGYHNIRIWLIIIPFILLELVIFWFKDRRNKDKEGDDKDA